jgi:hypothetical protein
VLDNSAEGDMWVYEGGIKRCLKKTVLFAKYYSDDESKGHEMGGTCSANTKRNVFWWRNRKETDQLENLRVDGKIILKRICK